MNTLTHDLVQQNKPNEAEEKSSGTPYRRPELIPLGSLENVQGNYKMHYWDGPSSWNTYDG